MKREEMENATDVKVTKKASKNVLRSLSVGLAAMMALSTPIATFAEDVDAQNGDGETPEESTTSVSTQKPAAEQVKDIQDGSAKTAAGSISEAKKAVDNAIKTARNDNSGADQATRDAAGELDSVANGSVESGTKGNVAENAVENTIAQIEKAEEAAEKTDAALDKANEKAEEANTIADEAAKEQQEAKAALDEAAGKIESATTVEEAQNAYNEATGIVGDAQTAYEEAKAAYDSKVAEYNTALDELKAAQEAYDAAVASASTEVEAAAANLVAVQQKAEELQQAAEAAKAAIPELTDAQKAALEIIKLESERAEDTSTNWRKEDELFKVILQNYYMPELIRGELVDCKWTWNADDNKNYCEVTYTDVAGNPHTVYLNYKINDKGDDIIIFEKNDEVVSYDVKSADGKIAFNIDAKNFPLSDLTNDQDTASYVKDGVEYTIVNVNGTYYVADSKTTHMGTALKYTDDSKYVASGEKTTIYSVDDNGNLIKTVKQNVTEITYTDKALSSDKTYESVEAAEDALNKDKAELEKEGAKDINASMSATATAKVEVSQKTTFTTVIDLSKIIVEMKAIKYDNDKYEKKNAEIAAHELFDKFTNIDALQELLGEDYVIEGINQDNAKVNDRKQYKNTSKRWTDSFADSAAYTNVFSGTIVIKYSRTMTAESDIVEKLKTNEVNATDNSNLEELKGQAFDEAKADATNKLGEAASQNKKITDNLKTGELHINGYKSSFGKTDSNVTIKMRYDNGAFTEGTKQTDNALVVEENSSSNLSVSYTGTYQEKGFKDLGEQAVDMWKYGETAKAEEVKDHIGNSYYDDYKKTGKINEGIWLTGKNDDHFTSDENFKNFKDFKDAALKANAEKTEKEAKADAIIGAAKAAVDAVKTAQTDVETLQTQLTALLTSQNYTADQVKELEGQISAAEAKLKEAEEKAASLTDDLEIAEKSLADKIADLTPAPAPAPGGNGSTTNPTGGETTPEGTPSGSETAPAGAPSGTTATPTVSTTTAVAAETALADADPIEIAETPVALAATVPTAVAAAARTSVAANANADANADDNVVIEDEETPLADNGVQDEETTSITDEATPLAAEAGAMETMQQEKMSWWWVLIIALLGVTGEEMYRRNKKKKAEAVEKNEK